MSHKLFVPIDETFWSQIICDGDLCLQMGPKLLPLLSAGEFIEKKDLEKYKSKNLLVIKRVIDQDQYQIYLKMFSDLKDMIFEKDQRQQAKEILSSVHHEWQGNESHLLTFALAAFYSFNSLPDEELQKINETDLRLLKKSTYAGAICLLTAMSNGFYSFDILKDLYLVSFAMDIGLNGKDYTYHVSKAVDVEAEKHGRGREYLNSVKASQKEKNLFINHPEKGHAALQSLVHLFTYPELIEIILYQHETSDGKGFPRGITKREVSTWDAICLYADSVVLLSEIEKIETNTLSYLLSLSPAKQESLPVKRVFLKLKSMMTYFSNKDGESIAA